MTQAAAEAPQAPSPGDRRRQLLARLGLDWGTTTLQIFKRDPLLSWAFFLLALSALSPLLLTPVLPLVDMGSNMGAAGLLGDAFFHRGVVGEHYRVNLAPTPYWTAYSILTAANAMFGPFVAHKLLVAIDLLLLPLSMCRLAYALGRNPRIGLVGFLLAWDVNLYWGWVSFSMGMPLALFAIARLVEAKTPREGARVLPLSFLVAMTHVHAVALLGLVGFFTAFSKRPLARSLVTHAIGLSGGAVFLAPWLAKRFFGTGAPPVAEALSFSFPTAAERVQNLYSASLQVLPLRSGPVLTVAAFMIVLLTVSGLGALPRHRPVRPAQDMAAALALFCVVALYTSLPFSVGGRLTHWWTYPRFATYVLAFLMLVPRARLDGIYALAMGPLVVATFLVHGGIREQNVRFGQAVRPYVQIVAAMRPGTKMLPLDYDPNNPEAPFAPMGQLHGFAAAARHLYDGHLFDEPNNPLLFRQDKIVPHPNWYTFSGFTMEDHGKHYDYIIVRGLDRDPLVHRPAGGGFRAHLVKEAGTWRLYEVRPE